MITVSTLIANEHKDISEKIIYILKEIDVYSTSLWSLYLRFVMSTNQKVICFLSCYFFTTQLNINCNIFYVLTDAKNFKIIDRSVRYLASKFLLQAYRTIDANYLCNILWSCPIFCPSCDINFVLHPVELCRPPVQPSCCPIFYHPHLSTCSGSNKKPKCSMLLYNFDCTLALMLYIY